MSYRSSKRGRCRQADAFELGTCMHRGAPALPETLDPAGRKMHALMQGWSPTTSDRALKAGSTRRNKHITLAKV